MVFMCCISAGIEPARPLTLEEAKPKMVEALKNERVRERVRRRERRPRARFARRCKAGRKLPDALKQSGLPSEKIAPFSLAEQPPAKPAEGDKKPEPQPTPPDMMMIKSAVMNLEAGQVSEFVPTADRRPGRRAGKT